MTETSVRLTWTDADEHAAHHAAAELRFLRWLATHTPAGTTPAADIAIPGSRPGVGGQVEGAQHGAHPSPQDGIPYANEVEPDDEPDDGLIGALWRDVKDLARFAGKVAVTLALCAVVAWGVHH